MGSEGVLVGQSTVWSGIENPAGREPIWPWWVVGGRGVHRFVARSSYKSGHPARFCYQTGLVTSYHSGTIVTMWTHTRIRSDLRDRAKEQAARDGVSLSSFVERTLESALGEGLSMREAVADEPCSVSSRAPVKKEPNLPRRADTLPGDTLPASGKPSLRDTWSR